MPGRNSPSHGSGPRGASHGVDEENDADDGEAEADNPAAGFEQGDDGDDADGDIGASTRTGAPDDVVEKHREVKARNNRHDKKDGIDCRPERSAFLFGPKTGKVRKAIIRMRPRWIER